MAIGRFAFRVPGCGLTSKLQMVRPDAQRVIRQAHHPERSRRATRNA